MLRCALPGLIAFAISSSVWAIELPQPVIAAAQRLGHDDVLARIRAVPEVSLAQLLADMMAQGQPKLIGAGFAGLAFRSGNYIYKISNAVFARRGFLKIRSFVTMPSTETWRTSAHIIGEITHGVTTASLDALRGLVTEVTVGDSKREIMGASIWAHYEPTTVMPDMVTADAMGLRRPYIEGTPFRDFMENGKDSLDHWRRVAAVMALNERLLADYGLSIDLGNPAANFIVSGEGMNLIDNELFNPSLHTRDLYGRRGIVLPESGMADLFPIHWPTVLESPIINQKWAFNMRQALDYARIVGGAPTNREALRWLSRIPPHRFPYDNTFTYGVVQEAQIHCARTLSPWNGDVIPTSSGNMSWGQ